MIYIDMQDTQPTVYELFDTDDTVKIQYSPLGHWNPRIVSTTAMSITDTDKGSVHTISFGKNNIDLDVCELLQLYFLLDYLYNHSKLDCVTGFNKVNKLKFTEVK